MGHLTAAVVFIQKAGLNQRACVLRNGFEVGSQRAGKLCNRNAIVFLNGAQNGNAPMIGRPLKVPLQLFWRFHTLQKQACLTFQHSAECWNVVKNYYDIIILIAGETK